MKKGSLNIIFLLALFSSLFSVGQPTRKDSLFSLIKTNVSDSLKCIYLVEYINREADNSVWPKYNQQLKDVALKASENGEKRLRPFFLGMYSEGITNDGFLLQNRGKLNEALTEYRKALDIKLDINDKRGLSNVLINMGFLYQSAADYDKAINCYKRCLKIQEEFNDKPGASTTLVNLGTMYIEKGDTAKYEELVNKALKYKQAVNDINGISNCYNSLAVIYGNRNKVEEGIRLCSMALILLNENDNKEQLAHTCNNLGALYALKGEHNKALEFYNKALKINKQIGENRQTANSLIHIASIYLKNKNYKESKKYYSLALSYSKESNGLREQAGALHGLSRALAELGDKTESDKLELESKKIRDSIENLPIVKLDETWLDTLDYEKQGTAERALINESLASEVEESNLTWIIMVVGSLLVIAAILFILRRNN